MFYKDRDLEISIPENVARLVLEAKLEDLPFKVLRKGVPNPPGEEDFDKYKKYLNVDKSRVEIKKEDLHFFPEWDDIQRYLIKTYGNPTNVYNSLMQTKEFSIEKVHASLHPDQSDVVHLCCYGRVEWTLVDSEKKKEYKVILEPGDVLYMRGFTLHETKPLSVRGSLIFMNLSYEEFPDYLTDSFKSEEEAQEFYKQQKAGFLEELENR